MRILPFKPITLLSVLCLLLFSCKKENTGHKDVEAEATFSVDQISADIEPGVSTTSQGYTMLVLQPGKVDGRDTWIDWYAADPSYADANAGSIDQFKCLAWTIDGSPVYSRTLIQFEGLKFISATNKVLYAKMFLYGLSPGTIYLPQGNSYYPGSPYEDFGANNVYVQRITSPWDENSVTWNTQPSYTAVNKSEITPSTSQWNYNTSVEVTKMVKYFVNNPSKNYGFMLSLANESPYHSIGFYSSECNKPKKRPKLVVIYK